MTFYEITEQYKKLIKIALETFYCIELYVICFGSTCKKMQSTMSAAIFLFQ